MCALNMNNIEQYILEKYAGLVVKNTWGEKSFFYNPDRSRPNGTYFLTIKQQDGENDKASNLNREGVYRLNFCVSEQTFRALIGDKPKRPKKGGCIAGEYDFTTLSTLLPHPVYGWMRWLAILNPGEKEFEKIKPLLDEGYLLAVKKFNRGV